MPDVDPTPHDYPTHGFGLDRRRPEPAMSPTEMVREAAALLPRLVKLVYRLLRDPAVPLRRKALAGLAVGYVVSPIDLVPDFIPVAGQMDDLVMLALALHLLIESVPEDTRHRYWDGSEDAFELVAAVLAWGAEMVPERLRRYLP